MRFPKRTQNSFRYYSDAITTQWVQERAEMAVIPYLEGREWQTFGRYKKERHQTSGSRGTGVGQAQSRLLPFSPATCLPTASDTMSNRVMLHLSCHQRVHRRELEVAKTASRNGGVKRGLSRMRGNPHVRFLGALGRTNSARLPDRHKFSLVHARHVPST